MINLLAVTRFIIRTYTPLLKIFCSVLESGICVTIKYRLCVYSCGNNEMAIYKKIYSIYTFFIVLSIFMDGPKRDNIFERFCSFLITIFTNTYWNNMFSCTRASPILKICFHSCGNLFNTTSLHFWIIFRSRNLPWYSMEMQLRFSPFVTLYFTLGKSVILIPL